MCYLYIYLLNYKFYALFFVTVPIKGFVFLDINSSIFIKPKTTFQKFLIKFDEMVCLRFALITEREVGWVQSKHNHL